MDPELSKILLLAVPSTIGLALLIAHGFRHRPRPVMWGFLIASLAFGVLRGNAVHWLTVESSAALGDASGFGLMPYLIRSPLLRLGHASLQECVGWTFALYLGWCLAEGIQRRRGPEPGAPLTTVALVGLFMACISYAVEAAAGVLGWWRWSVPVTSRYLLDVPPVGLLDWFSVAADLFLPFALWLHRERFNRVLRWASLLVFPAHMASHLLDVVTGLRRVDTLIMPSDIAHWSMVLGLLALAMVARPAGSQPRPELAPSVEPWSRFFPSAVSLLLLTVIWTALGPVAARWDLWAATGPLTVFILLALPGVPLWAAGAVAVAFFPLAHWRGAAAAVCFALGWGLPVCGGWRATRRVRLALAATTCIAAAGAIVAQALAARRIERQYAEAVFGLASSPSPATARAAEAGRDRALATHPSPVILHMRAAASFRQSGAPILAAAEYRRALQLEPDLVWAHSQLGTLLQGMGRYGEAIAELERAVRLDPGSGQLRHNLGLAQLAAGQLDQARQSFQEAVELAPADDPFPVIGLARVEVAAGRADAAKELLRRAIAQGTARPELHCELAALEQSDGHLAAAEERCRRAIALDPRHAPAHRLLALVLSQRPERLGEAHAAALRAVALGEDALSLDTLGVVLLRSGQRGEARQALLRALRRCTSPEGCAAIKAHLAAAGPPGPR